ncbi:RDD family protein [Mucilaginibacter sp. HMF5004]|uniref:RDD family protein n=1 Tax=Mucilaginibacter rivuli TaxID=2857527 RepID=UPI001C5E7A1D|nr:RDD family protein [Mucilaginibacter rivuli]MBW4888699.1 RDD family protein [Mucilaginibacter rivuli]
MWKKHTPAIVIILGFIIAIGGIVNDALIDTHSFDVMDIQGFFRPLNLRLIFTDSLAYNGHNYVNAVFDMILLLGVIIYLATKKREPAVVRFAFAIIFLSNIISLTIGLGSFFWSIKKVFALGPLHVMIDILFYLKCLFWIYISYRVLAYFNDCIKLKEEVVAADGFLQNQLVKASSGRRFFHPVIDTLVTIVLFSPMLKWLIPEHNFFEPRRSGIEDHMALVIILLRMIYYLFYESVLGITPAKLLTSTRIVDENGSKPGFSNILARTLSRLVPFDAFSFFADDGWHDKWSRTFVVKEAGIGSEELH